MKNLSKIHLDFMIAVYVSFELNGVPHDLHDYGEHVDLYGIDSYNEVIYATSRYWRDEDDIYRCMIQGEYNGH